MSLIVFEYVCKNDNIKGIYLIFDYYNLIVCCMFVKNWERFVVIVKKYN